jgi:hypothetical protein
MTDVEDRPRRLVIRTERDDPDRVRLTVEDVGTGLILRPPIDCSTRSIPPRVTEWESDWPSVEPSSKDTVAVCGQRVERRPGATFASPFHASLTTPSLVLARRIRCSRDVVDDPVQRSWDARKPRFACGPRTRTVEPPSLLSAQARATDTKV